MTTNAGVRETERKSIGLPSSGQQCTDAMGEIAVYAGVLQPSLDKYYLVRSSAPGECDSSGCR